MRQQNLLAFLLLCLFEAYSQAVPSFSTVGLCVTHSNPRNSIRFLCLLHGSLDAPGVGVSHARV
jgi:hypothetical protein